MSGPEAQGPRTGARRWRSGGPGRPVGWWAQTALAWVLFAAAVVGVRQLTALVGGPGRQPDPFHGAGFWAAPAVLLLLRTAAELRGRVRVEPDVLEVRGLRTRRYRWASLRSLTLEENGRIEITPDGWVRQLPIPRPETPKAYRTLREWADRAKATAWNATALNAPGSDAPGSAPTGG